MPKITIDGEPVTVRVGTTVAVAILMAGEATFRRSVTGETRGPLCGMGICYECRVTIDGLEQCRSCQIVCADGMRVATK